MNDYNNSNSDSDIQSFNSQNPRTSTSPEERSKKRWIIIAIGIIYAIMPDLIPGPIDDIIVNIVTLYFGGVIGKKKVQ
ncbi:MAG: hypothetical protein K6B43_02620 [Treponema sp.]|nr:hypothetical protein [Treponema sp.]